jgi:formiminotetrahydrofolate cyclodeaminase
MEKKKGFTMSGFSAFTKKRSTQMEEANAEERAIMKQMKTIETQLKSITDKDSNRYKSLMDKHRNLSNQLPSFD